MKKKLLPFFRCHFGENLHNLFNISHNETKRSTTSSRLCRRFLFVRVCILVSFFIIQYEPVPIHRTLLCGNLLILCMAFPDSVRMYRILCLIWKSARGLLSLHHLFVYVRHSNILKTQYRQCQRHLKIFGSLLQPWHEIHGISPHLTSISNTSFGLTIFVTRTGKK